MHYWNLNNLTLLTSLHSSFLILFNILRRLAILHWIPTSHQPASVLLTHTELRSRLYLQALPYSHLHKDIYDAQIYFISEPWSSIPSRVCWKHSLLKFPLLAYPVYDWVLSVQTSLGRSRNKGVAILDMCIAKVTCKSHHHRLSEVERGRISFCFPVIPWCIAPRLTHSKQPFDHGVFERTNG